ncbi:MAG: universal stress protein [Methanomassiliicoccales archaeon]|nr:MAG: universal stress protein [Methanomassiliicoccales archaeon]
MFNKILIPTDGSGLEDHAIRYTAMAFPFARYHVISVIQPNVRGTHLTKLLRQMLEESAKKAISHAEKLLLGEGIEIQKKKVLFGIPSKEIIKYAKSEDMELLVMRSYCKSGVLSYRLGTTIENVLRHIHCPVLIITTSATQREPKRILLPIGGAHLEQKALENVAMNTAKSFNAQLTALYVIEGGRKGKGRAHAQKILENAAWKAKHFDIRLRKAIEQGDPGDIILHYADSHDLIIMGAGKKGVFRRVVLGHVAREICAPSPVPIILVRRHHLR